MAIYLKLDGVTGAVTASGYEGWIALESVTFSVERTVEQITGDMENRARNLPQCELISCSKQCDQASYGILNEAVKGNAGKNAEIHVCEPGDAPTPYVEYKMKDVIICSFEQSSDGDQPSEDFKLSFSDVEVKFTPHDASGAAGSPGIVGYDLKTAKAR